MAISPSVDPDYNHYYLAIQKKESAFFIGPFEDSVGEITGFVKLLPAFPDVRFTKLVFDKKVVIHEASQDKPSCVRIPYQAIAKRAGDKIGSFILVFGGFGGHPQTFSKVEQPQAYGPFKTEAERDLWLDSAHRFAKESLRYIVFTPPEIHPDPESNSECGYIDVELTEPRFAANFFRKISR